MPTHVSRIAARRMRLRAGKEREKEETGAIHSLLSFSGEEGGGGGDGEERKTRARDQKSVCDRARAPRHQVLHRTLTLRYRRRRLAATTLSHFGLSHLFRRTLSPCALCLLKSPLAPFARSPCRLLRPREIVASRNICVSTCMPGLSSCPSTTNPIQLTIVGEHLLPAIIFVLLS